jgi:hypothetical protein
MMMKSNNAYVISMVLALGLALMFALTLWPDVSLASKIGFFSAGAWFGISLGGWLALRRTQTT